MSCKELMKRSINKLEAYAHLSHTGPSVIFKKKCYSLYSNEIIPPYYNPTPRPIGSRLH